MTTVADPIIGSWYKDLENNLTFKVVTIDEVDDSIEVQYFNGDIGEYDRDSWYNSTFDYIEEPEDWSAPLTTLKPMIWAIRITTSTDLILKTWILTIIWTEQGNVLHENESTGVFGLAI